MIIIKVFIVNDSSVLSVAVDSVSFNNRDTIGELLLRFCIDGIQMRVL